MEHKNGLNRKAEEAGTQRRARFQQTLERRANEEGANQEVSGSLR